MMQLLNVEELKQKLRAFLNKFVGGGLKRNMTLPDLIMALLVVGLYLYVIITICLNIFNTVIQPKILPSASQLELEEMFYVMVFLKLIN